MYKKVLATEDLFIHSLMQLRYRLYRSCIYHNSMQCTEAQVKINITSMQYSNAVLGADSNSSTATHCNAYVVEYEQIYNWLKLQYRSLTYKSQYTLQQGKIACTSTEIANTCHDVKTLFIINFNFYNEGSSGPSWQHSWWILLFCQWMSIYHNYP